MSIESAEIFSSLVAIYILIGIVFAVYFVFSAVNKIDDNAKEGTIGFRILIFPGSVLLWPIFLSRLIRNIKSAPLDLTTHDKLT